ncbi:MAG: PadR family transcriptional regulator [Candidatus Gallimonas sp.]
MDEEEFEETGSDETEKEEKSISSDLIRGHINTIILRSLADGDKYGYEIISEIERKSHGQYSMKQPSLYSALKRLEREKYITSYWGGSVGGGRRKYFSLTDEGRAITDQNRSEWEYSRTIIDSLISDKDFDFSNPAPSSVNMRVLRDTTSRVPAREESEEENADYDVYLKDRAECDRLNACLEEKNAQLERERASFEEDRARYEQEISALRENEEQLRSEREERERELEERERTAEEERARTLCAERQNAEDERARYEAMLREREETLNEERARYERELVEQEQRIREEQEELFRKREQQLLHQNYLNLVNAPPPPAEETRDYNYYTTPVAQPEEEKEPEPDEKEYREVVRKLYANSSVKNDAPASPAIERARSLDGIDFNDIEAHAAQDGIRITTAGGLQKKNAAPESDSVVHKGKALFLSALAVFFLSVLEGGIVLGLQQKIEISPFLPYLMWGVALAVLLATGLAFANHYGERALRRCGPVLVNAIVSYVLVVILTLIVALGVNIDFSDPGKLASFVIIPVVYFFSIVVFGILYYLQVRPLKR